MKFTNIIMITLAFGFFGQMTLLQGGIIGMIVFPTHKQNVFKEESNHAYEFAKVNIQFFNPGQACLIADGHSIISTPITLADKSPEILQQLIDEGAEKAYSLYWHKNFKYLSIGDELKILIHIKDNEFEDCSISKNVYAKILKFMTLDQQSRTLCCYDFVKAVACNFIDTCIPVEHDNNFVHTIQKFVMRYADKESKFKPGDAIAFYSLNDNEPVLKHFALALGNGLYLSKNGIGGFLGVSDKKTLFDFWECDHCAKTTLVIAQNDHIN